MKGGGSTLAQIKKKIGMILDDLLALHRASPINQIA